MKTENVAQIIRTAYETAAFKQDFFNNVSGEEFIKVNHLEGVTADEVDQAIEDFKNELEAASQQED